MLPFLKTIGWFPWCLPPSSDGKVLYLHQNEQQLVAELDIWYCSYDAKSNAWGQTKNAGSTVNTPGSERYQALAMTAKNSIFFKLSSRPLAAWIFSWPKWARMVNSTSLLRTETLSTFIRRFRHCVWRKRIVAISQVNRPKRQRWRHIYSFYLPPLVFLHVKGFVYSGGDPNTGVGKGKQWKA